MITGENITDDRIRELRDQLAQEDWHAKKGPRTWARVAVCNCALAGGDAQLACVRNARHHARARCAEILNARQGGRS